MTSLLDSGWNCATCFFAHHWVERRTRSVPFKRGMFREFKNEEYTARGTQCLRYPVPEDVDAEHGCGEYRTASRIEARQGEDPKGLHRNDESLTPQGDAQ